MVVGQYKVEVLPHGLAVQDREQGVPGAVVQVEVQSEKVVVVQQAAVLWLQLVEQQSLLEKNRQLNEGTSFFFVVF